MSKKIVGIHIEPVENGNHVHVRHEITQPDEFEPGKQNISQETTKYVAGMDFHDRVWDALMKEGKK